MSILNQARSVAETARRCGALQSFATEITHIEQQGVKFVVRVAESQKMKERAAVKNAPKNRNPFQPYEPELFVCELGARHICLLNKFNVVDEHLLIVTREFEPQSGWLITDDFRAILPLLHEQDGLVFYNGGPIAGASQDHKHLQYIPNCALQDATQLPFDELYQHNTLPFKVFCSSLNRPLSAEMLYQTYLNAFTALGLSLPSESNTPAPYNLLLTRDRFILIPRRLGSYGDISVNSLGFSGSMFVKNALQLDELKGIGPLSLLVAVGYPHQPY